jgi:hypothetical protein
MMFLSSLLNAVQIALELLLVILLLRGPFRKYVVFSVYAVFALAADLVDNVTYYRLGWKSPLYRQLYWTDHIALDLVIFFVVIACTYQALQENHLRRKAAKALGAIAIAALALPFALIHNHHAKQYGFFSSQWFNHASQILNFGAAIMNLVLWVALLSNRRRDPKLVTLSVGLGVFTTAAAIAWGVRQWLAEENRWPLDILVTVTYIASLGLWCWVFRAKQTQRPGNAPPASSLPPNPNNAAPPDALTTPS